jgi:hypothetical protein
VLIGTVEVHKDLMFVMFVRIIFVQVYAPLLWRPFATPYRQRYATLVFVSWASWTSNDNAILHRFVRASCYIPARSAEFLVSFSSLYLNGLPGAG